MPEVEEAELFIIVLDKNDQAHGVTESFRTETTSSEDEFSAMGLANFFDTEDDNNVDWEEKLPLPAGESWGEGNK